MGLALTRTEQINLGVDELTSSGGDNEALHLGWLPQQDTPLCRVTCVDHVAPREGARLTRDGEWFFRSRKVSTLLLLMIWP